MIKINLATLPLGRELSKDLYGPDGQLLLKSGVILKLSHIDKLQQIGYESVYVISEDTVEKGEEGELPVVFLEAVENVRSLMTNVTQGHMVESQELEETMDLLFPEIIGTNNVFKFLSHLRHRDEYTLQHSVSVAVISIKIGQTLKMLPEELRNLGIAGVLHDIGKCRISLDIINKPGALNDKEFKEIQKHPQYGFEIVQNFNFPDPNIEKAVLQHHEHQDGSGYPLKVKADDIHLYSRILAVADVFDALTSDRVYRAKMPLLQAASLIHKSSYGHLDPQITYRLFNYIVNIFPGENVVLNTGEKAKVIKMNPGDPTRPLVQIGDRFVELEKERNIFIEDMLSSI